MNAPARHIETVPVSQVRAGDEIDMSGEIVVGNVAGANRQRHLIVRTTGGAEIAREYDPSSRVTVLR